jgi:hypothetical protein
VKPVTRYASVALNVRTGPGTDHAAVDVLARGSKVAAVGPAQAGWQRVQHERKIRWVKAAFLARKPPPREAATGASAGSRAGGISTAPCRYGSAVERGLTPRTVAVHRAVCARWPQLRSFGGFRPGSGSYHNSGRALDIMVRGDTGDAVAAWLRSNARALGITELIWQQRIWISRRSDGGWRPMADRGSATANHYDHVHVSVA